jgi:uncharacterized cupredoxin-like copper-binding protein
MTTSFLRVIVALFALTIVVAACASDTGAAWTYAPLTASETAAEVTEPAAATAAAEAVVAETAAAETAAAETAAAEVTPEADATAPAASNGEPRVIDIQADGALRFTDASGEPITDIPVTPGETVLFRVNNTAGFAHNFWIGTDEELIVPNGTTDTGMPDWSTGVEELEWVVPEDISGLKYGCTVPAHYTLMQGTFSVGEPADAAEPAEEPATASGEPRVIELEADGALRFLQDGEQIREISVTPGESVIFRIDNTAGFAHNFWIGADADLMVANGSTDVGLTDWETGIQELEWVVPDDITDIRFACTVPAHYTLMQGDFTVSP